MEEVNPPTIGKPPTTRPSRQAGYLQLAHGRRLSA